MELDFEVWFEVFRAGAFVVQWDDADDAASISGAGALKVGCDVGGAADVTIVTRDAVADPHSAVTSNVDDQHLVFSDTRRVECLPLAVLSPFCTQPFTVAAAKRHGICRVVQKAIPRF